MARKYTGVEERRNKFNGNEKSRSKSSFNLICLHDNPTETNSLTILVH